MFDLILTHAGLLVRVPILVAFMRLNWVLIYLYEGTVECLIFDLATSDVHGVLISGVSRLAFYFQWYANIA